MENKKEGEITPFGVGLHVKESIVENVVFKPVLEDRLHFHL